MSRPYHRREHPAVEPCDACRRPTARILFVPPSGMYRDELVPLCGSCVRVSPRLHASGWRVFRDGRGVYTGVVLDGLPGDTPSGP